MSDKAGWAVLGAGGISSDFLRALPAAQLGTLRAVGARDAGRARAFADEVPADFPGAAAGTYDEVLARDDVDAVYIGTVHTSHRELSLAALAAGKAVLCEKPLGIDVAETEEVLAAAEAAGLPLVEAFKYRFGPFPDLMRELVAGGDLGEIVEVEASIGFAADRGIARLFDPALAGGALLDAGCYPVSFAVGVAAWAGRLGASIPTVVSATGVIGETGVDEDASATLDLGGICAHMQTSITRALPRTAVIRGTRGELEGAAASPRPTRPCCAAPAAPTSTCTPRRSARWPPKPTRRSRHCAAAAPRCPRCPGPTPAPPPPCSRSGAPRWGERATLRRRRAGFDGAARRFRCLEPARCAIVSGGARHRRPRPTPQTPTRPQTPTPTPQGARGAARARRRPRPRHHASA